MIRVYDVAPLQVWRDEEGHSLTFDWFGIAPSGAALRVLFDQSRDIWAAEQRRSAQPLAMLVNLRQCLIPCTADLRWLTDTWGPSLLLAGMRAPLFVLSDEQLAIVVPRTPCAQVSPADDEPITAPALFADPARAQFQLRRRASRRVMA